MRHGLPAGQEAPESATEAVASSLSLMHLRAVAANRNANHALAAWRVRPNPSLKPTRYGNLARTSSQLDVPHENADKKANSEAST